MKTKLQEKFEKLSKPFEAKIKKAEHDYDKFLKDFVKSEIIGDKNFNDHLTIALESIRESNYYPSEKEFLYDYVNDAELLEIFILDQCDKLVYYKENTLEDYGPYPHALAKESISV